MVRCVTAIFGVALLVLLLCPPQCSAGFGIFKRKKDIATDGLPVDLKPGVASNDLALTDDLSLIKSDIKPSTLLMSAGGTFALVLMMMVRGMGMPSNMVMPSLAILGSVAFGLFYKVFDGKYRFNYPAAGALGCAFLVMLLNIMPKKAPQHYSESPSYLLLERYATTIGATAFGTLVFSRAAWRALGNRRRL